MSEKYPYQKEWKDYRKRKNIFILSFLAYFPIMILLMYLSGYLFGTSKFIGIDLNLVYFVGYLIFFGFCGFRFQLWKCPSCRKSFQSKWWWHNIFSSKCLHCKLPKYFGSTYFEQSWGTEKAKELIEKEKQKQ